MSRHNVPPMLCPIQRDNVTPLPRVSRLVCYAVAWPLPTRMKRGHEGIWEDRGKHGPERGIFWSDASDLPIAEPAHYQSYY